MGGEDGDGIRDYKVTGVQTCALPIYVDERRARDGIAADADDARVAEPALGQLVADLVGQRAGARHDADVALAEERGGDDADVGLARRRSEGRAVGEGVGLRWAEKTATAYEITR